MSGIRELEAVVRFADELIKEYEENNVEIPDFVYEKVIYVNNEFIKVLKAQTEVLKAQTEIIKAANKVFENKGV